MGLYAERIFPWILEHSDNDRLRAERGRLLAEARGSVLEIGSGTGANFQHYGDRVTAITTIEPSPGMNTRALRAPSGGVPLRLVAAEGECLPFADESFDTVVAIFVLCTIPDATRALQEARRVLDSAGRLLFLEHVIAGESGVRRWQRRIEPLWKRIGCGCHLTRDTESAIRASGFEVESIERFSLDGHPRIVAPSIRGAARRGSA